MTDKRTLWEQTDLRNLIERDLGKPKLGGSSSKCRQWPCPLHAEQHGASFTVYQNGWTCFGKCQRSGDVIAWLMEFHRLTREEAWIYLGLPESEVAKRFVQPPRPAHQAPVNAIAEPPSLEWQSAALAVVEEAEHMLWRPEQGAPARTYLHGRGLIDPVIRQARLGYWPGHYTEYDYQHGLGIPYGITIPHFEDGQLWGIKVRRAAGDPKYFPVFTDKRHEDRLGKATLQSSLYWGDQLLRGWPALVLEGEFDVLVAWQEARDLVCPVTVGASSYSINPRWYAALAGCNPILACLDRDVAGDKAADRLLELGARVKRIMPPCGKDLNDFYKAAPMRAVYNWLESILAEEKAVAA